MHVDLTKQESAKQEPFPLTRWLAEQETLQKHSEYDTYVATRDPAHPVFSSLFGKDTAEQFMHQVLFPLAENLIVVVII